MPSTSEHGMPPSVLVMALADGDLPDAPVPALLPLGGSTLLERLLAALATIPTTPALPTEGEAAAPLLVLADPSVHPAVERIVGARGRVLPAPAAGAAQQAGGTSVPEWNPAVRAAADRRAALREALPHLDPLAPVLVHDAARALTPESTVRAVITALEPGIEAVVPAIAVTDSVKATGPKGLRNVDRSSLVSLQGPRLLRRDLLAAGRRGRTTGRTAGPARRGPPAPARVGRWWGRNN